MASTFNSRALSLNRAWAVEELFGELPKASLSDFGAAVDISRDVGVFGNEATQVYELVDLVVLLAGCCDLQRW